MPLKMFTERKTVLQQADTVSELYNFHQNAPSLEIFIREYSICYNINKASEIKLSGTVSQVYIRLNFGCRLFVLLVHMEECGADWGENKEWHKEQKPVGPLEKPNKCYIVRYELLNVAWIPYHNYQYSYCVACLWRPTLDSSFRACAILIGCRDWLSARIIAAAPC